ncbi:MAG TPA: dihydropyrimidinase [Chloroflexota bacterium]
MLDLVVRSGTLVSADGLVQADLAIKDGRIVAVGDASAFSEAQRTLDATGKLVMPGFVDAHVHFNQPVGDVRTNDSWFEGTRAAAFGGTTTVVDFALPRPEETPLACVERRLAEAAPEAVIDYGVHACYTQQTTNQRSLAQLAELIQMGVPSVKLFTVYRDMFMATPADILGVLRELAGRGIAAVHAENASIVEQLTEHFVAAGQIGPRYHALSRPHVAEVEAMESVLSLARETGTPLYFVHMSARQARGVLERARADGVQVGAEVCPHYLVLTEDAYQLPDGHNYVCSPPVPSSEDGTALWAMVADGTVTIVSSDHCCFTLAQKQLGKEDFTRTPPGLPGVETRPSVLYSEGVARGRISASRFVQLVSTAPAQLVGLWPRKGHLGIGADADVVIFDPAIDWVVRASDLHMATDYTPYEGMPLRGRPSAVISHGEPVVVDGTFHGRAGVGRFIPRSIDSDVLAALLG